MNYEILQIEEQDGIALITINREKALNAINTQTMQELGQFFGEDGPNREGLKGVILTGAGEKAFVAGADIKEFMNFVDNGAQEMSMRGQDIFFLIERFHCPVVAAVKGFALGAGCELAMACHLRIAGPKAKFGQPEVNLGLIPGYGGTQRLIQYIGKGKAMELLLTADMIGAEEALQLGLVNKVVEAGEEIAESKKLIEKIGTKGPVAVAKTIASVNAYFDKNVNGFDFEVKAFGSSARTEDFVEGTTAFVEKRKANFTGK